MHQYRTHNCGQLTLKEVGREVKISGWVHRRRDHGGLVFLDLRDHYGLTQCVIDETNPIMEKVAHVRNESVVTITGMVSARSPDTINNNLATGEIELLIQTFYVESMADMLPLNVNNEHEYPEETRLKYRFLDLRREQVHNNIILRSQIISFIRQKMTELGFNEFQTPILTASSPEGARDFLVPSRLHPGKFYALPQSPQQFKQLLMVAGFDKYFQISPCFRDEDARADRSPGEFYQLDVEMSFVTQEDVFDSIEPVLRDTFLKFSKKTIPDSIFPRITFDEAMLKYGSDKPDLRIPIEICDVTNAFVDSEFSIFRENIKKGAIVRAIPAPSTSNQPRSFFDKMLAFAQENGAAGLGYIVFAEDGTAKGPIAKFLKPDQISEIKTTAKLKNGDSVFFSSDKPSLASSLAGKVRVKLGEELSLIDSNIFKFCWIIDFPFYEWNEDRKHIDFSHNPFSMPHGGLGVLEESNDLESLLAIRAYQYDIVCNGIELSSGAIRNHKPEIMYKAFEKVGYTKEAVDNKFGGMINAFKFGAPPHGGIAPGIDRIVMLLANEPNIREVIAFPMTQQAEDLLMLAPSEVDEKQLKELSIQIRLNNKK